MIKEYNLKGLCFMGYELNKNATFHHILKREYGGKEVIENGAVLNPNAHSYLHIIEYKDRDMFEYINGLLKKENEQGYVSSKDLRVIDDTLKIFEREHCSDTTKKGKLLLKAVYLKRTSHID